MKGGFPIILTAQFFSSLGDNALLFAAIALLKSLDAVAGLDEVIELKPDTAKNRPVAMALEVAARPGDNRLG